MSKRNNKRNLAKSILLCLAMGAGMIYTAPPAIAANEVVANNTLPKDPSVIAGNVGFNEAANNVLNVNQTGQNAVIKWGDFSVGANATVNFKANVNNFNTLNYVNSGNMSQIYGTINGQGGNIFLVNTAGVQIGNSAQINVGSLYVSNQNLSDAALKGFMNNPTTDYLSDQKGQTNAELMSLGNINATNVTFNGNRVVIDMDRITPTAGTATVNISGDKDNVVLGYTDLTQKNDKLNVNLTGTEKDAENASYQWVKDLTDLKEIDTNLNNGVKRYALRNAIDAVSTKDTAFTAIANFDNAKFDGLGYGIYGLNVGDTTTDNVGLFGSAKDSTIRNFELVGGKVTGKENVGAVVGNAVNTTIQNIVSSVDVSGTTNVGGIVGSGDNVDLSGLVNTGTTEGEVNVGGLAGELTNKSKLEVTASDSGSYSLGAVKGKDDKSHNIGGLVGHALGNSQLGSKNSSQIFNQLDVSGGYNIGGIVGNMENSHIENAANYGKVTATGFINDEYKYHGNTSGAYTDQIIKEETVTVANAGGIAGISSGSSIGNVINEGDVQSVEATQNSDTFYIAGNVGGIVGSATSTNIDDAENKENNIRGAHNVGGIAGYYTGNGTISDSVNNGGDIMGTGARNETGAVVEEAVRAVTANTGTDASGNPVEERFIIGNIGGIVGYMYDDGVRIENSGNRGTVHSKDIEDDNNVKQSSQAANVGGIVGKIDRNQTISYDINNLDIDKLTEDAAISNSYNTGDIRGYTGIGGIAGMMYNGEIVGSYNSGYIRTTRQSVGNDDIYTVINMGGIVGDATEQTSARVLIANSYNKGTIGDKTFLYKGRHVGGIAGRLAGDVINSYNKGDIYNGYAVTGGVAGWWTAGTIQNAFNTGNITVYNHDQRDPSQVGGIVGGTASWRGTGINVNKLINNAYNLGTLRSDNNGAATGHKSYVGGIIGRISYYTGADELAIKNVYTTGELYSSDSQFLNSIYGGLNTDSWALVQAPNVIENAYYIKPKDTSGFTALTDNQANKIIEYNQKDQISSYKYTDSNGVEHSLSFGTDAKDITNGDWRIYNGTTPILNAFLPQLATDTANKVTIDGVAVTSDSGNIQFGTAYNPFLSIFDKGNVAINDAKGEAIANTDSIAVYNGGSLTINNAENTSNTMYSGILYADGALTLNSAEGADIKLGSISSLYGSSVTINTDGEFVGYGTITATGANGNSNVNINAKSDVEIIGTVTSVKDGETTTVDGIGQIADKKDFTGKDITDMNDTMPTTGSQYQTEPTSKGNGNINIESETGDVNILYGNKENGYINSSGNLTVTGDNVYMDSDLSVGGNLTMTSGKGNNQEAVLDISNIGKHYADGQDQNMGMHQFLENFDKKTGNTISINSDNAKIAVDMWNDDNTLNLQKYDTPDTLISHLNTLNVTLNGKQQATDEIKNTVYIWVNNAEQLKNIQTYANAPENKDSGVLTYNFALKNDIDASGVTNYASIGGDKGFSGKFDGRDNRIVGLTSNNGGIFSTINESGSVKDVKVYDSNFSGSIVGAIANVNKGDISGITTFGNEVSSNGAGTVADKGVAASGGIAGVNEGTIHDSTVTDVIVAGTSSLPNDAISTAGGVVGVNVGKINNVGASSAVVATQGKAYSIGGVAGVNATNGKLNGEITDGKQLWYNRW